MVCNLTVFDPFEDRQYGLGTGTFGALGHPRLLGIHRCEFFRDSYHEELIDGGMILLGDLAGAGKERIGDSKGVLTHGSLAVMDGRYWLGVMTRMLKSAAGWKSRSLKVMMAAAPPLVAASNTNVVHLAPPRCIDRPNGILQTLGACLPGRGL